MSFMLSLQYTEVALFSPVTNILGHNGRHDSHKWQNVFLYLSVMTTELSQISFQYKMPW